MNPNFSYIKQWQALLHLAWPILAAQLSMTAMNFVDTIMAGNYANTDLAAVAIGGSIWLPTSLAAQSVLFSVTAIAAQHFGAKRLAEAGKALQQGLWLALASAMVMAGVIYVSSINLHWFGIEPELRRVTQGYLWFLCLAMPAATVYQALRAFIEASGRTRPIMVVNFLGLLANIPVNYIFIYGKFGMPELGGIGCGFATMMVFYLMAAGLAVYLLLSDLASVAFKKAWVWPNWLWQKQLLKLGLPISLTMFAEVSIFAAIALIIAPLGINEVAGHQVALSFTSQTFMVPLSLSMALTIHIGHLLGAGKADVAKFASKAGLVLAALLATLSSLFILGFSQTIASWYTDDATIIGIAVSLMFFAAIYQWPDALQVCAIGTLRAYKVTTAPLVIVLIAYWLITIPFGYSLGLTDKLASIGSFMGAKGLWIALVVGLSFAAVLLCWQLYLVANNEAENKTAVS